jgi:hypothetical protein
MDFGLFLPNFTKFDRFFRKPTESEGDDFLVSTYFLSTGAATTKATSLAAGMWDVLPLCIPL